MAFVASQVLLFAWLSDSMLVCCSPGFSDTQVYLVLMQNSGEDSKGSNGENVNQKWVYEGFKASETLCSLSCNVCE